MVLTALFAVAVVAQAGDSASAGVPARLSGEQVLAKVLDTHGHIGPWAVIGYRIGERGLTELKLPRHSKALLVVHHTPLVFKYTCAADGVMAATGATPGKMNLKVEEAPVEALRTVVTDRSTGRVLSFTVKPELAREMFAVTPAELHAMSQRIAALDDDALFSIAETHTEPTLERSSETILP